MLSPGMLCSEVEMGLGDTAEGIMTLSPSARPGDDVAGLIGAVDDIFEVNVTPNRPDALSHLGIARELAARYRTSLHLPVVDRMPEEEGMPALEVEIEDTHGCPRYLARFLTGLVVGPSPIAMRLRLTYCGMRTISNLVDVTNYVLLETGHPLHAFDLDRLTGNIVVRRARQGERLVTLDGQQRELVPSDLLICDSRGPVAIAGVMGGLDTEVSAKTSRVVIETATFDPPSIRRSAKRLALPSEASYRFERGVDAQGIPYASLRAGSLMAKLGGGKLMHATVDRGSPSPVETVVRLPLARLHRLTGHDYSLAFAADQLSRLAFTCAIVDEALQVTVPTFRPDVTIPEDLVEEILRLGEYGKPAHKERIATNRTSLDNPEETSDRVRALLAASGLSEIVTWAFVAKPTLSAINGSDNSEGVVVRNPISADYEVMRTSLLPGLADALRRNLARGMPDAWLFEVGTVVRQGTTAPIETIYAAGILAGRRDGWLKPGEPIDFFDLKGVVEGLLSGLGFTEVSFAPPATLAFLHPGVSARAQSQDGRLLGQLGELHPAVGRKLGIEATAYYFELEMAALSSPQPLRCSAPPKHPAINRDVSFWIDVSVSAAAQRAAFMAAAEPLLCELAVLEDYRDPEVTPVGKKGQLWTMTYRAPDRTLTDAQADQAHARVVLALRSTFTVQIR